MVTSAHEGMHRIFQERPEILGPVFGVLGVPFAVKATVDAVTTDVTETRPLEDGRIQCDLCPRLCKLHESRGASVSCGPGSATRPS